MKWVKRSLILFVLLIGAGFLYQQWAEARDAKLVPPPGQLISVGDHRLHIWCIGKGEPTVVMLPGGGTPSVTLYDAQVRIAKFTRVCSYDRTGLGWSDPATKPMALGDVVTDMEVLLQKSGVSGPIILAPESMGGLVALAYAKRNLDRVAGAVFIDASETQLYFDVIPPTVPQFKRKDVLWQFGWRTGIIRLLIPYAKPAFIDKVSPEIQAQFYAIWSRPIHSFSRDFIDLVEQTPVADQPQTTAGAWGDIPITVLRHGIVDGSTLPATELDWSAAQARLAALSSGGKVVTATKNGHMIAEENPDLVAVSVRDVVDVIRAKDS